MIFYNELLDFLVASLIIIILASPVILLSQAKQPVKLSGYQSKKFEIPFNITVPDTVYNLPKKLKEISGLTYQEPNSIYAINDEEGSLYLFNFETGDIVSEIDFGKDNDYEALTRKDNLIYASRSNGKIKVIDTKSKEKINDINTPLSERNNVEGLCFDSTTNKLLIACKGELEKHKNSKGKKGIYSYSLTTETFDKDPYLIIDLKKEVGTLKPINLSTNIIQVLGVNSRLNMFAPSGMAIDPITGHLYLLASRGKILMVIDKSKSTLGIYFLNQQLYGQPEGIVFDKKGNLYISNEAKANEANIISLMRKSKAIKLEEAKE